MRSVVVNVLIVEDDALVRMAGAVMIEDAGFHAVEAASADEAIEILEQGRDIHVVFSDVDMPGSIDGLALMVLIHRRWPDIGLILTSGHHHFQNAQLPDDGRFVAKPYRGDAIIEQIRELLAA